MMMKVQSTLGSIFLGALISAGCIAEGDYVSSDVDEIQEITQGYSTSPGIGKGGAHAFASDDDDDDLGGPASGDEDTCYQMCRFSQFTNTFSKKGSRNIISMTVEHEWQCPADQECVYGTCGSMTGALTGHGCTPPNEIPNPFDDF